MGRRYALTSLLARFPKISSQKKVDLREGFDCAQLLGVLTLWDEKFFCCWRAAGHCLK